MKKKTTGSDDEKKKEFEPSIVGKLYDATAEGFMTFIAEANVLEAGGYSLLSLVRLEKKIAAVFRLVRGKKRTYGAMFDDEEMVELDDGEEMVPL